MTDAKHQRLADQLRSKMKSLDETLWEGRAKEAHVNRWLAQFNSAEDLADDAELQMLFLASNFLYFGAREIRALLRSLFRDLYQYKMLEGIRKARSDTLDLAAIEEEYKSQLKNTRFIGVGNPSESGSHMLYYFRQENRLGKEYFINSHQVLSTTRFLLKHHTTRVRNPAIKHYVFIDDLCGSGSQAQDYCRSIVEPLKRLQSGVRVHYFTLFATSYGLQQIRNLRWFDEVAAVVELDESFKCFSDKSRIYSDVVAPIDKDKARQISHRHGTKLATKFPLGWRDGQLLLGFFHNTPDNTLPIIWHDDPEGHSWTPLFRRFPKQYGWEA
ncbi:phosphoribosyltransferase-like protein [Bradyrhizobium japonicum]|uniref:phosphoribosyltransferase-like protein n=1 Tax=Bradyrhizobium japonicum TaxID=375 RepID=UPI00271505CD|nr:hypothetical protein [Bradyrhizobium japonicum]WLB53801.1 hypothetical protein QIH94_42465 [Bradyrhizobium japonicum]WLB64326.1 hypothetical protein QIH96_03320 [Bradyrhizobium japonicum]